MLPIAQPVGSCSADRRGIAIAWKIFTLLIYAPVIVSAFLSVSLLRTVAEQTGISSFAAPSINQTSEHAEIEGNPTPLLGESIIFIRDRMSRHGMPPNPRMYFIHIGKAGGISLRRSMDANRIKSMLPCRMNKTRYGEDDDDCRVPMPGESEVFRHILSYFHIANQDHTEEENRWLLNSSNTFLYSVRDPIDRLVSAYNYHKHIDVGSIRHRNFYIECFPHGMNSLMDTKRYKGHNESIKKCKAKDLGAGGTHFSLNYQYYMEYTLRSRPNHSVAVIRMESMWDDVMRLDLALGGTGEIRGTGTKLTHGSERHDYNANLTLPNQIYLCCLLQSEMEAYQRLVLKAFNLNYFQKNKTLSALLAKCNINAVGDLVRDPFSWRKWYHKSGTCNN
mmetsp:Transcript_34270/g.82887  ORF Transcript_34270/g.82887 Transcript_34270/m.82887 type:complete len:391 (+) Transcript_34270:98-1270(+)|eukprot:CAMPEP_0181137454 /NCGR_PEP_ID=MMETSP1071-20121207/33716_1 /TAXON_ID=35127 /ORGANISM="Thalassiosira sp., Strain NH16" /LENGTH=390 /DNA_ID=CAMNT_0023224213 /DNA_START=64 /DNA_END=1236 /DNA_ORIENTATION=+